MAELKFSGGDKLQSKLAEIGRKLGKNKTLRVGFLEGATYPDGTPVALVAAAQNFGSPAQGIPPRPFFSNMISEKSNGWGDSFAAIMKDQRNDVDKSLELLGQGIAGQLRQSIVETNEPALADATIARKGFAKPLIDTSNMINSIDSEVTE